MGVDLDGDGDVNGAAFDPAHPCCRDLATGRLGHPGAGSPGTRFIHVAVAVAVKVQVNVDGDARGMASAGRIIE